MDVTRTKTWATGDVLTASDLNDEFSNLLDSPEISNSDVASDADIAESKLAFDTTSGHDHDGTDSKSVTTTGFSSGFSVTISGDQTITKSTVTKVTFDTEGYDTGSEFASNKFTVTTAGKYLFCYGIYALSVADSKTVRMLIYKNGTAAKTSVFHTGGGTHVFPNMSVILDLDADDYIEFYVEQTDSVSRDIDSTSYAMGQRLA